MLGALLLAAVQTQGAWFGPAKVTFDLNVPGNPYDAFDNDVRVRFASGGKFTERFAYYDGLHWDAYLLAHKPGAYSVGVTLNGRQVKELPAISLPGTPSPTKFVRVNQRGFETDDGKPFWPMGNDLAWRSDGLPPLPVTLAQMGQAGMNWSRIWACPWDGKNPWWPMDKSKLPIGDLNQPAFQIWDGIVQAADKAGIHFQWVLFHHGEFSSTVNPNWPENPWNKANGGFLSDPVEFFTDQQARRLTKNYLRYVVARYAHEPSIMAWELFNEVQFTDAAQKNHWDLVARWHQEMSIYLHSIDPYHHPVTSSSEMRPEITDACDYYQAHGYPSNLGAMLFGTKVPTDRPFFYGEIGLNSEPTPAQERMAVRDGIWDALLSGHSGAGEYWSWDNVVRMDLMNEWTRAKTGIHELGIRPGPDIRPIQVDSDSGVGSTLIFAPGLGWEASKQLDFSFPRDATGLAPGGLSRFLQGKAHPEMGSHVSFIFNSRVPGVASVSFGEAATSGAEIVARVDGREVARVVVKGGRQDGPVTVSAPFGPGGHTVRFENVGADWVDVSAYTFTHLGPNASVAGATQGARVLLRVQRSPDRSTPVSLRMSALPLTDGAHRLTGYDLDTGRTWQDHVEISQGALRKPLPLSAKDAILAIEP